MTSYLTMFDSAFDSTFPRGGQAYAAYLDGQVGSQPNFSWIVAEFPNAFHLSITLSAQVDGDCLDVEFGAAGVQDIPGWHQRQRARGVARPAIYANASTIQSGVVPLVKSGQIPRAEVRLWSGHYAGEHICGPSTCGAVSLDMDGTQWTPNAYGRSLDQSLLLPGFFTAPHPAPAPAPSPVTSWQEAIMNQLPVLGEGAVDEPGHVFFVHRLQALTACYGQITGLAEAAALKVDGSFGPATKAAVIASQQHAGIATDGIVGSVTWSVLLTGAP